MTGRRRLALLAAPILLAAVLAAPLLVPVERLLPEPTVGTGPEDPLAHGLCSLAELYTGLLAHVAERHRSGGNAGTAARLEARIARVERLCGRAAPEAGPPGG